MKNGDDTERISSLSQILRDDVTECIKDITEDGQTNRSHEEQIEFELRVRFWLENQLVPAVMAVACGVYDFDASVLNQKMPELISSFVSGLPEAEFLTRISKLIDPERWAVISTNLGTSSQPLAVQAFNDALYRNEIENS